MLRRTMGAVLAISLAAMLSACTDEPPAPSETAQTPAASPAESPAATTRSPYEEVDFSLKLNDVDGQGLKGTKNYFSSLNRMKGLLDKLGAPANANQRSRANNLLNNPGSTLLKGLGGIQARAAVEAGRMTLKNDGQFGGGLTTFTVKGQIQQEVDGEAGFYFKQGQPMHIWVKITTTQARGAAAVTTTEMFRVEIPADALHVEAKVNGEFPDFEAAAFDFTPNPVMNWKLWAVSDKVRVTDYRVKAGNTWLEYTAANAPAKYKSIFEPDPDACFDMLFIDDPRNLVGGKLPPNAAPPFYCLGRCKNPPIVNTQ